MRDLDRQFSLENGVTDYEDLIDELRVDIPVEDGDVIEAGAYIASLLQTMLEKKASGIDLR